MNYNEPDFHHIFDFINKERRHYINAILEEEPTAINQIGYCGKTLLHFAAAEDDIEFATFLLEKGINPNKGRGKGALCWVKSIEMAELLLKHGAKIHNKRDCGALYKAVESGKPELIQFFIDKGAKIEGDDNEGESLLFSSIYGAKNSQDKINCLKVLLKNKANINRFGRYGSSILEQYHNDLEILKFLVENGARLHTNYLGDNSYTYALLNLGYPKKDNLDILDYLKTSFPNETKFEVNCILNQCWNLKILQSEPNYIKSEDYFISFFNPNIILKWKLIHDKIKVLQFLQLNFKYNVQIGISEKLGIIAVPNNNSEVLILDIDTFQTLESFEYNLSNEEESSGVHSANFSLDNKSLIISDYYTTQIFDLKTKEKKQINLNIEQISYSKFTSHEGILQVYMVNEGGSGAVFYRKTIDNQFLKVDRLFIDNFTRGYNSMYLYLSENTAFIKQTENKKLEYFDCDIRQYYHAKKQVNWKTRPKTKKKWAFDCERPFYFAKVCFGINCVFLTDYNKILVLDSKTGQLQKTMECGNNNPILSIYYVKALHQLLIGTNEEIKLLKID